ncbi:MAG TPA: UbiA-like polyprenyltransferase [Humisphaera sp.]|jgi:4-hydroxybenzoate polyprenyltransferase|nr:UbiA-like polyprenyltransferase [Humisphaera sp.]
MTTDAASIQPQTATPRRQFTYRLSTFAGDIKIAHTIFALPFALLSTFLAAGGWPKLGQLALILVCMVTARTLAMAVNRLLDAKLDADNPRTARRAIPAGALSRGFYWMIVTLCAAGFVAATGGFRWAYHNPWPLRMSLPVLLLLSAYPLLKRFTRYCHYYLGACLAIAPLCAWVAIRGSIDPPPFWIFGAVLLWTAGFDIIYACQDYQIDVAAGLFSVPAKVGIAKALWISRITHVGCAAMLLGLGIFTPQLGAFYFVGAGIAIALLIGEQMLVRAEDLSKVNLAFFTLNGFISLIVGTLGIVDVLRHA